MTGNRVLPPHPMTVCGKKPFFWVDPGNDENTLNGPDFEVLKQKTNGTSDFIQSVAVNQPFLNIDGLGTGRDSLQTDRANGFESIVSLNALPAAGELTFFLLFKFTQLSILATNTLLTIYGAGGNTLTVYILPDLRISVNVISTSLNSDITVTPGGVYLLSVRYSWNKQLFKMRINRVDQTETALPPNPVLGGIIVLGNDPWNPRCGTIDYGRFVGYKKYPEDYQVELLEQGYYNYYGLL